jgi:iron complex outermembrane receptor protein
MKECWIQLSLACHIQIINTDELEGDSIGTTYKKKSFEGRALITHHHEDTLEGGVGLQFNHEDLSVEGEEAFIPDAETTSPALFTVEDFSLNDSLVWQIGGRIEHSNIDPIGLDSKSFNPLSASTGLIWHDEAKEYNSALTFSYSERAPNVSELFSNGVHVASQIYENGNTELDTENSLSLELVLRKLTGAVRGSIGTFIQDYGNYINLQNSGESFEDFPIYNYDEIEARIWGMEAEVEGDLYKSGGHLLTLYSGFDLVRGRNKTNDDNLPRLTPVRTKVGLEYAYDKFSSFLEAVRAEKQDNTAEYELATDGYTLLNTGVDYIVAQEDALKVKLFVKGTNLTDEEARIHSSFLKDLAPLRGRAFFAGMRMEF